jgi:hypothetical protein
MVMLVPPLSERAMPPGQTIAAWSIADERPGGAAAGDGG